MSSRSGSSEEEEEEEDDDDEEEEQEEEQESSAAEESDAESEKQPEQDNGNAQVQQKQQLIAQSLVDLQSMASEMDAIKHQLQTRLRQSKEQKRAQEQAELRKKQQEQELLNQKELEMQQRVHQIERQLRQAHQEQEQKLLLELETKRRLEQEQLLQQRQQEELQRQEEARQRQEQHELIQHQLQQLLQMQKLQQQQQQAANESKPTIKLQMCVEVQTDIDANEMGHLLDLKHQMMDQDSVAESDDPDHQYNALQELELLTVNLQPMSASELITEPLALSNEAPLQVMQSVPTSVGPYQPATRFRSTTSSALIDDPLAVLSSHPDTFRSSEHFQFPENTFSPVVARSRGTAPVDLPPASGMVTLEQAMAQALPTDHGSLQTSKSSSTAPLSPVQRRPPSLPTKQQELEGLQGSTGSSLPATRVVGAPLTPAAASSVSSLPAAAAATTTTTASAPGASGALGASVSLSSSRDSERSAPAPTSLPVGSNTSSASRASVRGGSHPVASATQSIPSVPSHPSWISHGSTHSRTSAKSSLWSESGAEFHPSDSLDFNQRYSTSLRDSMASEKRTRQSVQRELSAMRNLLSR